MYPAHGIQLGGLVDTTRKSLWQVSPGQFDCSRAERAEYTSQMSVLDIDPTEFKILKSLSNPRKVQDFLDTIPINYEKKGETYMSPRRTLREKRAHCIEGALIAALAFWMHGKRPLLMDFTTVTDDEDHVIAPFQENGYWGAVSKTNHAILRYRDPVYKTLRELAMSYFHEYYMFEDGRKTLVSFSVPLDLSTLGTSWITSEEDLDFVADALDAARHFPARPQANVRRIRNAAKVELRAGKIVEWDKKNPRT